MSRGKCVIPDPGGPNLKSRERRTPTELQEYHCLIPSYTNGTGGITAKTGNQQLYFENVTLASDKDKGGIMQTGANNSW